LEPKLLKEQFDTKGLAEIQCQFRNYKIRVIYQNKEGKDWPDYIIDSLELDGSKLEYSNPENKRKIIIPFEKISQSTGKDIITIKVSLK
jgi:hypothetical protein